MKNEKIDYIKKGKSLRILAWVLIGFCVLYFILGITGNLEVNEDVSLVSVLIMMFIMFGGGGALVLYRAYSYINKGKRYLRYNRYMAIINIGNDTLIDNIAAAYPTTYERATADIQAMIDEGYLTNAYVDLNRGELIIAQKTAANNVAENQKVSFAESQTVSVECKHCGGINKVVAGAANKCEYCGSSLQGE